MAYDYSDLLNDAQDWAKKANQQDWLTAQQLASLDSDDMTQFAQEMPSRPMLIAFMGGTGVGKSSLLNRLAGRAIAKAGIARPTSREVTVYYHRDVTLPDLPLREVSISHHDDDSQKMMVWIDMPDFDSTDVQNKALVLQWMPYIDMLIYVVSPERYRDEKAWQLLISQGARHAWLFVLNQWDVGQQVQAEDFEHQLHLAGFDAPLIFKTSCTQVLVDDEFASLTQTIGSLATQKTLEQLAYHGRQVRVQALQKQLQVGLSYLGEPVAVQKLHTHWQKHWKLTAKQLQQGFAWRLPLHAEQFAMHASDLRIVSSDMLLWDGWAQTRFDDVLNETLLYAQRQHLPILPLEKSMSSIRTSAKKALHHAVELETRQSLAKRGTWLHRGLLKLVGMAEIVLPLGAMSWVGVQVFNGYYESNQTHLHYLSIDFAVHSVLVCALSWVIPFFILKKCQPSLEKSALRGLNKGVANGLDVLNQDVLALISQFELDQLQHKHQVNELLKASESISSQHLTFDPESPLERMLVSEDRIK
jgi:hypothetical protein